MQIMFKARIATEEGFKVLGSFLSATKADALVAAQAKFPEEADKITMQGDNKMPPKVRNTKPNHLLAKKKAAA